MRRGELEARVSILFGIIQQLQETRRAKLFAKIDLSHSQIALLSHFRNNPTKRATITDLARVMEMNQPGMTKVVKHLAAKGCLSIEPDDVDSRRKWVSMTEEGLSTITKLLIAAAPEMAKVYQSWSDEELEQLRALLDKHKNWLDENRETVVPIGIDP